MDAMYRCPHCRGTLRQARGRLDFFCRPCRTAIAVVDEHWVVVMRPTDLTRQVLPLAACSTRNTEPLASPPHTAPLAHPA